MSGALKSSGVAVSQATGSLADQMAKSTPALVLHRGVDQAGLRGDYADDRLQGVDSFIAGSGRLQTTLHLAAANAAPNSPVTEYLPLGKGCDAPAARRRTDWTEERITALGDLFEAGWSHELIAQAFGMSKGAISAKLDRLAEADPKKWTRSATIISLKPDRSGMAAKAEERRAQAAMVKAIEESVVGVGLLELEPCMCRWPMAYTTEQTFCGDDRAPSSSYCADHLARSVTR